MTLTGTCWVCGGTFPAVGADGLFVHAIQAHEDDPLVREIMRRLAPLPLPVQYPLVQRGRGR